MDILLILIVVICVFLGWYYTKYNDTLKKISKLPGPPKWPLIGNAFVFLGKTPVEMLLKIEAIVQEYPRLTCLMLGAQPEILITDPKMSEFFLSSQKLITKSDEYRFFNDWIGTGLLTSTGKKWFARRKVITPAFHFKILDQFVEIFDKHGDTFIQHLEKSNGRAIDIFTPVTLCALDNICGEICIAFGF